MLFPACYCKIRSAKGEYFVEGRFFTNSPHLSLPHPTNTVKIRLVKELIYPVDGVTRRLWVVKSQVVWHCILAMPPILQQCNMSDDALLHCVLHYVITLHPCRLHCIPAMPPILQ